MLIMTTKENIQFIKLPENFKADLGSFTIDSSERFEDYPTILRAQSLQVNADIHLIDPDFASFAREVLRRNQIEAKLTFVSSYARYEYLYQQRRFS